MFLPGGVAVGYFFVADTQLDKDVCNMNEDSFGPKGKTSSLSSSGGAEFVARYKMVENSMRLCSPSVIRVVTDWCFVVEFSCQTGSIMP